MASSDTLSVFVPNVGESVTEPTSSGARVFTTNTGDSLNSHIFPNMGGAIDDVGIKVPATGNTRTTFFGGTSADTSFIGNGDDNSVTFTGNATDAFISTGDGDDSVTAPAISDGIVSLGDGDNSAVTGALDGTSISAGTGDDFIAILDDANSVRVSTSSGNDTLIFGGNVSQSSIFLGKGADVLSFSGSVETTFVDLGNDAKLDQVFFSSKDDIGMGTEIFGAGDGDLLIIGGEEYVFDSDQMSFTTDDDTITFG